MSLQSTLYSHFLPPLGQNGTFKKRAISCLSSRDVDNPYIVYGISVNKLVYREQRDDKPDIAQKKEWARYLKIIFACAQQNRRTMNYKTEI